MISNVDEFAFFCYFPCQCFDPVKYVVVGVKSSFWNISGTV